MKIYVCAKHGVGGEMYLGVGTVVEIRASGCVLCRHETAKQVLRDASQKLMLYRAKQSEYVGGVEYTELQHRIAEVLKS